jgi:hypothetical protein
MTLLPNSSCLWVIIGADDDSTDILIQAGKSKPYATCALGSKFGADSQIFRLSGFRPTHFDLETLEFSH